MKADLHLHSVFSDGDSTPSYIAQKAKLAGAELISLTDHDTVDGAEEAARAAREQGIKFLSGIEVSSYISCEVHILGYNIDIGNKAFLGRLQALRRQRLIRLEKILEKLKTEGVSLAEDDVIKSAGEVSSLGRMHIARALRQKGYVKKINDAFDKWLGMGRPAYVEANRLLPSEAIELIKKAGGKAVLAHPSLIAIPKQLLPALVTDLKNKGLDGIEAIYSAHTKEENWQYLKLAGELGLIPTCGSDYHGDSRESDITAYELIWEDYLRLIS